MIRPVKELKGFEKVELAPGEEKEVSFTLDKRSFAYYNTEISDWDVETGDFTIMIGKSSRDIALSAVVRVESTRQYKRVFTINSTFGDIMADPKGQEIVSRCFGKNSGCICRRTQGYCPGRRVGRQKTVHWEFNRNTGSAGGQCGFFLYDEIWCVGKL